MHPLSKLTLLLIFSSTLALTLGVKPYKAQCSKDAECDSKQFLECNLHSYYCDCPKSTLWSPSLQQCRTMEGRPCDFPHQNHQIYQKYPKSPDCVENSSCISGKCKCHDGYLRNGFGLCDLGYGMPCEGDNNSNSGNGNNSPACSWRYSLECPKLAGNYSESERRCRCRGELIDYVWDGGRQKCVSLVGTGCDSDNSDGADDRLECVKGAGCVQERCECLSSYSVTPSRECKLNYGEKCDNNLGDYCNLSRFLNCQDGKCGCELFGQMLYDEGAKECRMLEGEFCDLPQTEQSNVNSNVINGNPDTFDSSVRKCVEGAGCVKGNHGRKGKGRCTCRQGMAKSPKGTCIPYGHGLPCSFDGDCNKEAYLICLIEDANGGHCACMPNEMFNNGTACLVLPGRSCVKNQKCGRGSNCDNGEYCMCNEGYFIDPIKFDCRLEAQTVPNVMVESRTEKNDFKEVWTTLNDCLKLHKDSVDFQKCECSFQSSSHIWTQDKCLGLVGSYCQVASDCVELAYCDTDENICQCESEARTTLENMCVPKTKRSNSNSIGHEDNHRHGHEERGHHDNDMGTGAMVMKTTSSAVTVQTLSFLSVIGVFGLLLV